MPLLCMRPNGNQAWDVPHSGGVVSASIGRVPPAGFEPAPLPPEGSALSPELRGLRRSKASSQRVPRSRVAGRYSLRRVSSLGRVLVVDDDDVIRQLITVNLELEGFDVT